MENTAELGFEKRYRLVREVIETIVLTLLMFLVIRLAVQNFNVDGHSMEPNLHDGELILVDKWSYLLRPPARGDVIVFAAPPQPSQDYVKRIIGLPGDVITIQGTAVSVNGQLLHESFIDPHRQGNPFPSFANRVVPPNTYFVLGDNRGGSSDSRDWGCVPQANLIGRAVLVYWPLGQDNNGFIPNASAAFSNIPPPDAKSTNACQVIKNGSIQASSDSHDSSLPVSMALTLTMPALFVVFSHVNKRKRQHGPSAKD